MRKNERFSILNRKLQFYIEAPKKEKVLSVYFG